MDKKCKNCDYFSWCISENPSSFCVDYAPIGHGLFNDPRYVEVEK